MLLKSYIYGILTFEFKDSIVKLGIHSNLNLEGRYEHILTIEVKEIKMKNEEKVPDRAKLIKAFKKFFQIVGQDTLRIWIETNKTLEIDEKINDFINFI
jgi:hypothetical protein